MGVFNQGNDKFITCKMGYMVPIQLQEVLPGDNWKMRSKAMIRLAPMLAPQFSRVKVRIHHWFVPNRLVWDEFTDFITGGEDGMNASVFPTLEIDEFAGEGSLLDHLGVNPSAAENTLVSALPVRAYQLIKKLFYRDQDLETAPVIDVGSGPDTTTDLSLQQFCWDKDYFTTARPWAQKGPDVTIPLSGGPADIDRVSNAAAWRAVDSGTNNIAGGGNTQFDGAGLMTDSTTTVSLDPMGGLEADTDDLYIQIPDLRVSAALYRYQENRSRFGGNYPDYLNFLGVRYSDQRLQRPEYLGGDQGVISMSEVLQTSPESTDGDSDASGVGTMTGHGLASFGRQAIRYRAEEHGHIISIMMVAPDSMIGDGIHRMWLRNTKEDFWQKELEHIGQEGIYNRELCAQAAGGYDPGGRFGFQDRYQSYREGTGHPCVAGEMRSSLAFWHMARLLDPMAVVPYELNDSFVRCTPTTRVYQATWEDQLWCKIDNRAKVRSMVTANARPVLF